MGSNYSLCFLDYRVGAINISSNGKKIIKKMILGEEVTQENSMLSKREWNELMNSLGFENKMI